MALSKKKREMPCHALIGRSLLDVRARQTNIPYPSCFLFGDGAWHMAPLRTMARCGQQKDGKNCLLQLGRRTASIAAIAVQPVDIKWKKTTKKE